MTKVLVIGVDTMLGANLALVCGKQMDCVGLWDQFEVEPAGTSTEPCDLRQPSAVVAAIESHRPDWVVYAGAAARSAWDVPAERQITGAAADPIRQAAEATISRGSQFALLSSDAVFAGPRLFHEETWPAAAATPFAQAVRRSEESLRGLPVLVVRTHAFGWSATEEEPCWAESLALKLTAGADPELDGQRYATPILASDLAELLLGAVRPRLTGLYHITGAERTNPHRFGAELAAALGVEPFRSTTASECTVAVARPVAETSLNTRRARRELGRAMPLLREGLECFAAQSTNGYLDELRAGSHTLAAARAA
ncbi:MAG: sugar nucleotide-binding protein [Pirellulales bacterium]|nr:sugar nucleotide-binding protein [Pirellulales bacterium]